MPEPLQGLYFTFFGTVLNIIEEFQKPEVPIIALLASILLFGIKPCLGVVPLRFGAFGESPPPVNFVEANPPLKTPFNGYPLA